MATFPIDPDPKSRVESINPPPQLRLASHAIWPPVGLAELQGAKGPVADALCPKALRPERIWKADGKRTLQIGRIVTDILLLAAISTLVLTRFTSAHTFVNQHASLLLLYGALILLLCHQYDLYRAPHSRVRLDECLVVAKALAIATLLIAISLCVSGLGIVSAAVIVLSGLLSLATLTAWRLGEGKLIERRVINGHDARRVLIVGANDVGQRVAQSLTENRQWGYVVQGFLDESQHSNGRRVLGRIEDLTRVTRAEFVDEILIALPWGKELVNKVVQDARRNHLGVKVVADYDGLTWGTPLDYIEQVPVFTLHEETKHTFAHSVKRLIDILISTIGLIVISPLLALIAIAIKIDSPGPTFYRSIRVGKKGRRFVFLKFRSMVVSADQLKADLSSLNEREGLLFKLKNDPRVTQVGRFLRKYSLDELPQLWNVLKGDMSLVGPRPPTTDEYEQYSLEHLGRLDVIPGITGLWQTSAREDPSFEKALALDIEYIENWTLSLDFKILLRTVPTVLGGTGC